MPQHVTVVPYDPAWPAKFEQEKQVVAAILADNCLAIYHIGSTSVPQLAAKPIIDMMPVVRSLAQADAVAARFEAAGYEYMGEFGIAGRRYLRKGGDERTHHIHIFQADRAEGWANIRRHLAFCAHLRANAAARQQYALLKQQLAQRFAYDIEGYCDGKAAFVRRLEQQALLQYDCTWDQLYLAARQVQCPRALSAQAQAGAVAAALLTRQGNLYTGVCIDTACSLGLCAERSAIAAMVTNGESEIAKLVAVMPGGRVGMPCGACRELMMQLGNNAGQAEILCDYTTKQTIRLQALMPHWWCAAT